MGDDDAVTLVSSLMNNQLQRGLSVLWDLGEKIHGGDGDGLDIAESIAWVLPQAQVCGVYSRPIGALEMIAVRVGSLVVGAAGVWPSGDYGAQVRKAGLVGAPCFLRPYNTASTKVSPLLTEAFVRTPEFQELLLAA